MNGSDASDQTTAMEMRKISLSTIPTMKKATTTRDEVDIERLSDALVGAVKDTVQLAQASLWLQEKQEVGPHA